ncbi:MAG: dipeptide/oligopeptide/nickel ABC transporter ATP-binding protein [Candidatus Faecousia sp.]|nr:dipeptide/oligopeptide/nickel ABC transporter ATP-binding protein [Candidatus Faecousia sp.]
MRLEKLSKTYKSRTGSGSFYAVREADVTLEPGQTVGLFGDSGSGKSTLGMMAAGLLKPTSGNIYYEEAPLGWPFQGQARKNIQILFQHPEVSFNPALPLIRSMVEPYRLYGLPYSKEILIADVERYGLHEEHLYRCPGELSGGELQRAALARLLVLQPKVLVLDEPTSMLDVITQAQMVAMLRDYQKETGASYLFITHNRSLCDRVCDKVYDVEQGNITLEE